MKKFNEIEKLERAYSVPFSMALAQLMVMGIENASKITNEDIEKCQENDMMTKEFAQSLFRMTRDLSNYDAWDIFAYIKEKVAIYGCHDWSRYITIAHNAIILLEENGYDKEELLNELGVDEDEYDEIMED